MSNRVNLTLDVTKTGIQNPLIKVRQGDGGFETLRTTVTSNGEPLDLQGWTITFMGTTAGNHKIVDGNVTLVEAPNGIFDYTPGKAWGMDVGDFKIAYFKFVKEDGSASSANFRVNVIEAVDLTQEEAQNYISVVDTTIAEINQHLTNSLANVTQSIAATSSTASSLSVQVSSAVNQVNSATSSATSVASSAINIVSSVASSAVDNVNSTASSAASYIAINDAQLVHKTGNETIPGDKTFTGKLTSTQPIDGAISTRNATFTDFNDVARNMVKYSGSWVIADQSIANSPLQNYYTAIITPGFTGGTDGYIELVPFAGGVSKKYIAVVGSGTLSVWKSYSFDDDVVHKTGTETIAGDKTFTGASTLTNVKSSSVKTGSATLNGLTINFRQTVVGVNVFMDGSFQGDFGTSNTYITNSNGVPSTIDKPRQHVVLNIIGNGGVGGTTTNSTFKLEVLIATDGTIKYRAKNLRENDTTSRNSTIVGAASTFYSLD